MTPAEIDVLCPGCNALFSAPAELCGEMAECTECSTVFEIPNPNAAPPTPAVSAVKFSAPPSPAFTPPTNPAGIDDSAAVYTIKLTRSMIGMIPNLNENITIRQKPTGAETATPFAQYGNLAATPSPARPLQQPPTLQSLPQWKTSFFDESSPLPPPTAKPLSPPSSPFPAETASFTQAPAVKEPQAAQAKLPPWTKIQLKQGEELQACREINRHPVFTAALISSPVLLTIVAMFFAETQAIIVVSLWLITFIMALLLAKESSKRAVVLTNQRTICFFGKNIIELKGTSKN